VHASFISQPKEIPVPTGNIESQRYTDIGMEKINNGDFSGAIAALENAIKVDGKNVHAYIHLSNTLSLLGDDDNAFELLMRANDLDPNNSDIARCMGIIAYKKGDTALALEGYGLAIELNPMDAAAHLFRGVVYLKSGDYSTAVGDFDKAIRIAPSMGAPYTQKAIALFQLNDLAGAIQASRDCLRLSSEDNFKAEARDFISRNS
jgi:tetratricopeptide (TPR) repeat protein